MKNYQDELIEKCKNYKIAIRNARRERAVARTGDSDSVMFLNDLFALASDADGDEVPSATDADGDEATDADGDEATDADGKTVKEDTQLVISEIVRSKVYCPDPAKTELWKAMSCLTVDCPTTTLMPLSKASLTTMVQKYETQINELSALLETANTNLVKSEHNKASFKTARDAMGTFVSKLRRDKVLKDYAEALTEKGVLTECNLGREYTITCLVDKAPRYIPLSQFGFFKKLVQRLAWNMQMFTLEIKDGIFHVCWKMVTGTTTQPAVGSGRKCAILCVPTGAQDPFIRTLTDNVYNLYSCEEEGSSNICKTDSTRIIPIKFPGQDPMLTNWITAKMTSNAMPANLICT